jgi:uncharacterized membrane protein YkvA (DUF1232 family)
MRWSGPGIRPDLPRLDVLSEYIIGRSARTLAGAKSKDRGINLNAAIEKWRESTKRLKSETYAIYLAYRDPRVPLHAKAFAALIVGYAFSPIDLIPDFIPVLGYLDDLILVPAGIALALRMIPPEVMENARARSKEAISNGRPTNKLAAIVVVLIWLLLAGIGIAILSKVFRAS